MWRFHSCLHLRHRPLVAPTPYGLMITVVRLDLLRLSTSAVLPAEDKYSGDLVHTIVSTLPNLSSRHLNPPSSLPPELPFLPLTIRGITELWLSHSTSASGWNTHCLISLLKMERRLEIHFPSIRHSHIPTMCRVWRWGSLIERKTGPTSDWIHLRLASARQR